MVEDELVRLLALSYTCSNFMSPQCIYKKRCTEAEGDAEFTPSTIFMDWDMKSYDVKVRYI